MNQRITLTIESAENGYIITLQAQGKQQRLVGKDEAETQALCAQALKDAFTPPAGEAKQ